MTRRNRQGQSRAGYTLIEVLMSSAIVAMAGGGIYLALTAGVNLLAKNTSVNVAHQQVLTAVARIRRDVHSSVASPTLLNVDSALPPNLTANTGNGPAAGVVVQPLWEKPCILIRQASGYSPIVGATLAMVDAGGVSRPRPSPGQRIYYPGDDLLEDNIMSASPNATTPGNTDINIQNPAWKSIAGSTSGAVIGKMVLITTPTAYVTWSNGELHRYQQQSDGTSVSWQDQGVISRGLTLLTPFSLSNALIGANESNNSVTGVLTVATPDYNRRGYRAIDVSVRFQAPYRARLSRF